MRKNYEPTTNSQDVSNIGEFLKNLRAQVIKDAPKWSLDPQPPYNFDALEQYARSNFPENCDESTFQKAIIDFALKGLSSGNYTEKAYSAWVLGVLANVPEEKNQENVILDKIVPQLWKELLEKGSVFSIGDFINPCILNVVRPCPARTAFISRIVELLCDRTHDKMKICGFNILLDHSTRLDAHLGAYNLEDEKTEITRALVDKLGADELIKWCNHDGQIKLKISFLENVLQRERPENILAIANAIVTQIPAHIFAKNIAEIFNQDVAEAGSFPFAALRFFPLFMNALSEDKKTEYGAAVLNAFGPEGIVSAMNLYLSWMGGNHPIRNFINGFPLPQSQKIVEQLTDFALARDYAVPPEEYNQSPDMYWNFSNFAISVHDIIPEKCLAFYEDRIMDFLERKDCPDYGIVTAAILLRGRITEGKQPHKTQEIDFYPTCSFTTTDSMAHIKPRAGQNTSSMVTLGDFVGTMDEYFNALANPQNGAPRYMPPNGKPIDRRERYAVFSPQLSASHEAALKGDIASLPSLREFLSARHLAMN